MPPPSAAVQIRRVLEPCKRQGVEFSQAWYRAYNLVQWPHPTPQRLFEKEMIRAQRPIWQAAYLNQADVPGGRALLVLAASLTDEHRPTTGDVTGAPVGRMTPDAKAA